MKYDKKDIQLKIRTLQSIHCKNHAYDRYNVEEIPNFYTDGRLSQVFFPSQSNHCDFCKRHSEGAGPSSVVQS